MEQITYKNKKTHLVRVNLYHPQIPKELKGRSISFKNRAIDFVNALWEVIDNKNKKEK